MTINVSAQTAHNDLECSEGNNLKSAVKLTAACSAGLLRVDIKVSKCF